LCEQLGDMPALIRAAGGQWSYHLMRAEIGSALRVAEGLLRRAEQEDSLEVRLAAHRLVGIGMLHKGHMPCARRHLEAAASILDRAGEGAARMPGGKDALMGVPAYRAILLLLLGHYDQAKAQIALGLAEAERSARPHRSAFALAMAVWFHSLLDEDAPQHLDALAKRAAEQGFSYWARIALMFRGVSLARGGETREGVVLVRKGVALQDAAGAAWPLPAFLAIVAELAKGREGHALVTEAFARSAGTDSPYFLPELHRIRGVLRARKGDAAGAEADFIRAIDLARDQGAKHWELRAATGLARLWHDQGRRAEARGLLAPIYGWFTEGFDLPHLRDAKALLDRLG
jgi:predicted ATPase